MDIGMIGLGRMGANMALRLIQAGHRVVSFDLEPIDPPVIFLPPRTVALRVRLAVGCGKSVGPVVRELADARGDTGG